MTSVVTPLRRYREGVPVIIALLTTRPGCRYSLRMTATSLRSAPWPRTEDTIPRQWRALVGSPSRSWIVSRTFPARLDDRIKSAMGAPPPACSRDPYLATTIPSAARNIDTSHQNVGPDAVSRNKKLHIRRNDNAPVALVSLPGKDAESRARDSLVRESGGGVIRPSTASPFAA